MSDQSIGWMINGGRRAESEETRRQRRQRSDLVAAHRAALDRHASSIPWAAALARVGGRLEDLASRRRAARTPRTPDCCPA